MCVREREREKEREREREKAFAISIQATIGRELGGGGDYSARVNKERRPHNHLALANSLSILNFNCSKRMHYATTHHACTVQHSILDNKSLYYRHYLH